MQRGNNAKHSAIKKNEQNLREKKNIKSRKEQRVKGMRESILLD